MIFFRFIKVILFCIILTSCTSVKITEYQAETPQLTLEDYLNGTIDAYGIFQDRSGKVIKRFECVITATWNNNIGTLDEKFKYSDGTTSQRIWTITKISANNYTGTATDVEGTAKGTSSGNAFQWQYDLKLNVDGTDYIVSFDDWMFLMNNKIMINQSKMSKWGFYLGTVSLTFIKR